MLQILYQDDHLIAINKPHGLLVHRSSIAADTEEFALQLLRDQAGKKVNPVHRLDRKTGGVLLFAFNKEVEIAMQQQFSKNQVLKKYLAIVRGYNYPLRKENGTLQDAITAYITLQQAELPLAFGQHQTSRYSLIEVTPATGRMHQIRKHMSHVFHPIIGDRTHGCNKQNKLFKETWEMDTMLLHASNLLFNHPVTGKSISIQAPLHNEYLRVINMMGWQPINL
jgi:tRNA pseudouridine65 synthase